MIVAPAASLAHHSDTEPELLGRLANETHPTKKAKIEIRLGRLKLEQAAAAYDKDQVEAGAKLLDSYLSWMKQAWNLLHDSGRDASHRPQGFIDLDIALREDVRKLADLRVHTPLADRTPIERIGVETDALHTQVLAALFPGGQLEGSGSPTQAKPEKGPASALRPEGSPP
ncbi:MAG TPA: hypothetical protein VMT20_17470 [Terriglobia bacterium]|nr:hypothetical protein [Terriglobia bacterium]